LVELYTGVPLFPGENELDQLLCMMEVLGIPPESLLKSATRTRNFFDAENKPKILPNSRGKKRYPGSRSLKEFLIGTDHLYQDFVGKCLDWNPATRLTPDQGLGHPWIKALEKVQSTPRGTRRYSHAGVMGTNSTRHSKTTSFVFV
jgi:serine/threonine protein kinase